MICILFHCAFSLVVIWEAIWRQIAPSAKTFHIVNAAKLCMLYLGKCLKMSTTWRESSPSSKGSWCHLRTQRSVVIKLQCQACLNWINAVYDNILFGLFCYQIECKPVVIMGLCVTGSNRLLLLQMNSWGQQCQLEVLTLCFISSQNPHLDCYTVV